MSLVNEHQDERIEALEREVNGLRTELEQLKAVVIRSEVKPKQAISKQIPPEKVLHKIEQSTEKNWSLVEPDIQQTQDQKPQRSLEESIMWALPKVFMIILVLGVLWGLKLVSDYGYLSDAVKIVMAYALSVGLAVLAYVMESKQKGSPAVTVALYGGAFIVGILATAAGAIIYDVLGLYVALILALMYIAYGIAISYLRQNEVLTCFVAFTSLLLPYLLEYMDFNGMIIVGFVVILMAVLQIVVLKHRQTAALYITTFFSVLAVAIVGDINYENNAVLYGLSIVFIAAIFLYSACRLYDSIVKWKAVYEGLIFSAIVFMLGILNLVMNNEDYVALVLVAFITVLSLFALNAWKLQLRAVFDVLVTLAVLTLINVFLVLNLTPDTEQLLVVLTAFAGLMVALRLRADIMKVTYTLVFGMTALILFIANRVEPLFALENFTLLLIIAMLVAVYFYAKRPKTALSKFEQWMQKIYVLELLQLVIVLFGFMYVMKMDTQLFPQWDKMYATLLLAAVGAALSITVPKQVVGRFVPVFFIATYFIGLFSITVGWWVPTTETPINITMKLVYIAVTIAILGDLYMEGRIYQNWKKPIADRLEWLMIAGIVITIGLSISLWNFLEFADIASWNANVLLNTVTIFTGAAVTLLLGTKREWSSVKLAGFTLLIIAIFKLIFFDLSSLDLLIRSLLFIGVGGVGLLLSNRLLKK